MLTLKGQSRSFTAVVLNAEPGLSKESVDDRRPGYWMHLGRLLQ
jgi:hypothetical protein